MKSKSDRYFITDVIEKLASKAYIVVADSKIEELTKKQQDEEDEDEHESNNGVIVKAGDVVRFGRVCYLIKETSVDQERKAICEISRK